MEVDQKNEIVALAQDYERKRQDFAGHQMLNTYGRTSAQLLEMAAEYHVAEAAMIEAKGRLDRAKDFRPVDVGQQDR